MLKRDYDGQNCSIARTLAIVGERWTLLIVRDAYLGRRRFEEFHESLGISRNVLTERLTRLVDEEILERSPLPGASDALEYRLTQKGRDLRIALTALRQWGDTYVSEKPPTLLRRRPTGGPSSPRSCPKGREHPRREPGRERPGARRCRCGDEVDRFGYCRAMPPAGAARTAPLGVVQGLRLEGPMSLAPPRLSAR